MLKVIKIKLAELLKKNGHGEKSLRELAQEIGIDHVSLWKMLNGKPYNLGLHNLDKLCAYLECRPGDLLEYKKGK